MFLIVMGVSGSGKSTVGALLAQRLGCPFYDGDDWHPPENIAKMAAGIPLEDDDRRAWLAGLADLIRHGLTNGQQGVIACSALKESYRAGLRVDPAQVQFVYLRGDYATIWARMAGRTGHFMQPAMLQSQFNALEEPLDAWIVDVRLTPEQAVDQILAQHRPIGQPVQQSTCLLTLPQNR
jgi:gluconokinase